ncbi:hypothetical protein GOODEAATRI_005429 [Goodea atripinnis]|uniref:Uncharacterized protein n=1 Tax=Goodea atripinnis TaxID=208336 RepID=A0ABV0MGC4_9TELE
MSGLIFMPKDQLKKHLLRKTLTCSALIFPTVHGIEMHSVGQQSKSVLWKQPNAETRGGYNIVADTASLLIHGALRSIEIEKILAREGEKASILADAILIK